MMGRGVRTRLQALLRVTAFAAAALLLALISACDLEDDDGAAESTIPLDELPGTIAIGFEPTATPSPEPTPTPEAWLQTLYESGKTLPPAGQIFFRNGPDLWLLDSDLTATPVLTDQRLGPIASASDGSRAAAVILTTQGTRSAEEIRLVEPDGTLSEPIYGPEITSGPVANPPVTRIAWSPSGDRLSLALADGSLLIIPTDPNNDEITPVQALEPQGENAIEKLVWAPAGNALAALVRDDAGAGVLYLVSADGSEQLEVTPNQSFTAVDWLPGRARLAITETSTDTANVFAGSVLTTAPDGTDRTLLLSGGEFAPIVRISLLNASPDGRWLGLIVQMPGPDGEFQFQSLWLLDLETNFLRNVSVRRNVIVTDLWWSTAGPIWRGIIIENRDEELNETYDGTEPFIIGAYNTEESTSRIIFEAEPR